MATTTEQLMQEGLPLMRDMIAEINDGDAFVAPAELGESEGEEYPLAGYVDTLGALADAVGRGDEPTIARLEATLLVDPALRARPEPERVPELDDDTVYVEGAAGVLYLFRDEAHALTDAGQVVHLGDFTPAANARDFAAQGEETVYVEVGDWVEYGDDGAHGPIRAGAPYWAMVDWADDEEGEADSGY